jgi:DNA-binding LacI/PurR family transcriptional regulator
MMALPFGSTCVPRAPGVDVQQGSETGHLDAVGLRGVSLLAESRLAVIRLLGADFGTTALVGFDDFPLADLLRPGLTVVAQGEAEIGRTTIDLFRARLADPARPIQTVTVPTTLIARGSGELPS